ncbi:MAG TPA: MFS transporter [Burkholderiales bacterium]|nr:MFS transporter [Burkholderiales bacterium]
MHVPDRAEQSPTGRFLYTLLLLWLAGMALRITVLAVPPVIPLIHEDFHLSQTGIGILSGLPPLLFAAAAIPGSLLIARFGAQTTLIGGLLLTAAASALRGIAPDVALLFGTTLMMGVGIAVMQPALPPIVREWLPHRIGFATAIYSNGLLVGETLAASLTIPFVLPLVGGSWRSSFVFWAIPVLITAGLVALRTRTMGKATTMVPPRARRWWPDWTNPLTWKLGLIMGGISSLYFGTNAFIPDYLHKTGRSDLVSSALTAINLCQIPASAMMLLWAQRLTRRRAPYAAIGVLSAAGVAGLTLMPGAWAVVWSGVIGFCSAFGLILTLALPPLLADPDDVHRMSAAMFTIGYACAVVIPIIGGFGWDATGIPAMAFVPAGVCAVIIVWLASTLDFGEQPIIVPPAPGA